MRYHTATITIYNIDESYQLVQELLHRFAKNICLRVGYPVEGKKTAIIFLILKMTNDRLGALSGKIGQLDSVQIKTTSLKIN